MEFFPVFLSVVLVVRNQADQLKGMIAETVSALSPLVHDYEIIVVDNASYDDSIRVLKELTTEEGFPNLQVYALTKEVDGDTASWVGLESALGDFVGVINPLTEDISFLPEMLEAAVQGADVVFARNTHKPQRTLAYRTASWCFNYLYETLIGINLDRDAPHYRLLSKNVINFILRHSQPAMTYRHLPATGGFSRVNLSYSHPPKRINAKRLGESIDRGMRLLVSTTRAPMRVVTALSLFGAGANLMYSLYVVAIGIFKTDVAPGWISMSLQQSGMFFLISLVLLVLGEYILQMASSSNEGPLYHVGQEFTSYRMTRREKLNIEETTPRNTDQPFPPFKKVL
jgi:hypothetical protein